MSLVAALIPPERWQTMPKSKHDSLAYTMKKMAIENLSQNATTNDEICHCKTAIDNFCAWTKERGYTHEYVESDALNCLKEYAFSMLAAPAKGLGIEIEKLKED